MAQDYNKTLNLPKTDFPMRAGLPQSEPVTLESWDKKEIYKKLMEKNEGKPQFILHDGPPYANGNIHLGTALNKVLKDFIVRYKNMSGFNAPFVHPLLLLAQKCFPHFSFQKIGIAILAQIIERNVVFSKYIYNFVIQRMGHIACIHKYHICAQKFLFIERNIMPVQNLQFGVFLFELIAPVNVTAKNIYLFTVYIAIQRNIL